MLSKTKKARKNAQLKQLMIRQGSITRAEAVENIDLDIRTATSYLERLCRQGFCVKEKEEPDGKGRPGLLYRTNFDNMVFVGVLIAQYMVVECVLCSINGNILDRKSWKCNSRQSKLTVFNSILSLINDIAASYPYKSLGGIGVAVSRWLQPPLATYDLYSGLIKFLEKQTNVEVYRNLNINALAYHQANSSGCKDVIVFHAGNVIELGIIQNGRNIQNYQEHENALSHLQVNDKGPSCYCGKKGCLENYVTNSALLESLSKEIPDAVIGDITRELPEIKRIRENIVDYMTQACFYLCETYKPQEIFLIIHKDVSDDIARECIKEKLKCKVSFIKTEDHAVVKGAALMAAFMAVKQYK
jgi:predicted NBD/HSP70 family sugar kinase